MNDTDSRAGFNITNSKIQLVEIKKEADHYILFNLNEINFDEPVNFKNGKEAELRAQLQSSLDKLNITRPIKSKYASFILPSELFLSMQVPFDSTLLYNDLVEEFKWELSVLYPWAEIDDIIVRYIEIEKNLVVTKNTALVTGLNRKYLKLINDICTNNGMVLQFVDSAHFAAERSLEFSSSYVKEGLTLSVFAGKRLVSILLSYNTVPVYYKVFPVTKEEQIAEFINEELKPSEIKYINKNLIASSYISGDDVTSELKTKLDRTVNLTFNVFNPFRKIKAAPDVEENELYKYKFNSFAPAAGISYRI